jgi:hypothetical protein
MRLTAATLFACLAIPPCARLARADSVPVEPEPVAILGHLVESRDSKDMGRIVDLLVDHDGHPLAAVLDVGGFLGVGNRKVVVAWSALRFSAAGGGKLTVMIDIPTDRINAAPAYDPKKPVKALATDAPD